MKKRIKSPTIKEFIIVKKLLHKSEELLKIDTIENNLIATSNLNSALNIFLKIISTQQKIKSLKELDNVSLEKQWSILSSEYERRYGQKLSMKTQIFTLSNIIQNFIEYNIIPSNAQLLELYQALLVFVQELTRRVFEMEFQDIDFYLLFENPQLRKILKTTRDAFDVDEYEEVLRKCSQAFHIALEDQRQKLNYLSEKGLLKPELIMLNKNIKLHLNPKDQEFIHLILGTSPKKLDQFMKLIPTALISEDEQKRPEIIISNYVDKNLVSKENAYFCLNFVLETILYWESLELMKK